MLFNRSIIENVCSYDSNSCSMCANVLYLLVHFAEVLQNVLEPCIYYLAFVLKLNLAIVEVVRLWFKFTIYILLNSSLVFYFLHSADLEQIVQKVIYFVKSVRTNLNRLSFVLTKQVVDNFSSSCSLKVHINIR